ERKSVVEGKGGDFRGRRITKKKKRSAGAEARSPAGTRGAAVYAAARPDSAVAAEVAGRSVFFQAEDGIRDWSVTGVHTCALPISHHPSLRRQLLSHGVWRIPLRRGCVSDYTVRPVHRRVQLSFGQCHSDRAQWSCSVPSTARGQRRLSMGDHSRWWRRKAELRWRVWLWHRLSRQQGWDVIPECLRVLHSAHLPGRSQSSRGSHANRERHNLWHHLWTG